jgi:hypothetical protein
MKSHWVVTFLIILILALLGCVYTLGYRVGPGLSLLKAHTLTLDSLPPGALVYSDQAARGAAKGTSISLDLTPGNHTLLASAEGYQPWEEIVVVPENANVTVHALLIPKIPQTVPTEQLQGAEKADALKFINAATLPSASSTLALAGGCALISVSNNRILGEATTTSGCTPPPYLCSEGDCSSTILFSPVDTIRSVVAYPHRTDAVIVSAGGMIYALEVDPRTPRTFAPLLKAVAPRLAEKPDGTILIEDIGHVYSLSL